MNKIFSRVVVLLGLCLVACQSINTTQPGVVGVERPQSMLLAQGQVDGMAQTQYRETLAAAQKKNQLNRNAQQVQRVRDVMKRLIPHTAVFRTDAPKWAWEANVITDPKQLNAWCMPGGKIVVYSALIEKLQLTDDELAAIMGHEISHALREHSREKMSKAVGANLLFSIVGVAAGVDTQLAAQGYELLVGLPNSREMEVEADRMGVELMARAGYNPQAAVAVWQKMQRSGGGSPPEFLSTHPATSNRIQDLSEYAKRVEPLYQATQKTSS
jgi:predicted Zn-dependent protease